MLHTACLQNDELNQSFVSYEPKAISDGTLISTPGKEGIDADKLVDIYRGVYTNDDLWSLRSLLVYRNGKLVAESYLKDEDDLMTRHLVWSCTKQVMGILTGIAIDEGVIGDLDDPVSDYFDGELSEHQDKSTITIRNMITMQSGIDYNNDGSGGETDKLLRQIPDNSVEFILSRPLNAEQGTVFHYNDGNPHLMSAILQKATGMPTDQWADAVLFDHIGMSNYNWVRYKDGVTFGGFGIETTPRELAKIALCVADSGRWNGQQLIAGTWIEEMTRPQVVIDDSDYEFGYYWWIDPIRKIHFMWGHGGQFAFIVPHKDLIVVMTSIPNTQGNYQIHAHEALPVVDLIIEASNE